MSFFQDAAERSGTGTRDRPPAPDRARRSSPRRRGPAGPRARRRQLIAFGGVIVVLILIVVGVNALRDSSRRDSLRSYQANVTALASESDRQVARPLFKLLTGAGHRSQTDVQTQLNGLHVLSQQELARAKALSVPGSMQDAQRDLLLVLGFRADGVGRIAQLEQKAVAGAGSDRGAARASIADQMRQLLASDVIYARRVVPLMRQALADGGLATQPIEHVGGFLPDARWLSTGFVSTTLGASSSATAKGAKGGKVAPGTHGHALTSVAVGGVTLSPGTTNRLVAGANSAFTVTVQNQGDNDESGVPVKIRITGAGAPIELDKTVAKTTAGQSASVAVPLTSTPPLGRLVTIKVTIAPVRGEGVTSNNSQTYQAVFSSG